MSGNIQKRGKCKKYIKSTYNLKTIYWKIILFLFFGIMDSLNENTMFGECSTEGLIPKKVRFRDKDESVNMELEVDQIEKQTTSWKDKLVGSSPNYGGIDLKANEDFELLKGDGQKSFINDIPSIEFSNKIQHVLIRGMDNVAT